MRNQSVFVFDDKSIFSIQKRLARFCIELGYGTHLLKKTRTILKLSSLYGRENSKNTNKKEIVRVFWATVRVGLSMFRCRLDKDPTTKSSLGVLLCPQLKLCIRNFG